MMDAFAPVSRRLHEIGVPASTIGNILRDCATVIEKVTAFAAEREAEARRPKLVVVNPDPDPPA